MELSYDQQPGSLSERKEQGWGLEEMDLFLLRRPANASRKGESPSEVVQDRIRLLRGESFYLLTASAGSGPHGTRSMVVISTHVLR